MKVILSILCLINYFYCFSQNKLGNEWITGGGGQRIVFKNNTILTNKNYFVNTYFMIGHSDICDTSGKLILSSDGYNIYDSISQFLEGGDTIVPMNLYNYYGGHTLMSQSSIFLPMDSNKYYFITPTFSDLQFNDCIANNNCYFDLLLVNEIDMNANAGQGKVSKRMQTIVEHGRMRKTQMMACRHGNGKDWWLLKNEGDSANVHLFLFTQDSVYDKGVQIFSEPVWGGWDLVGQSTFNGDGSLFATTSDGSGSLASLGLVFISDFDRCYGILSNPRVLDMPWGSQHNPFDTTLMDKQSGGLCFSQNSRFLYVSSYANIYQYDFWDSSWYHVAGLDTTGIAAQMYNTAYMGPDGRIYIGNFGGQSKQMSRIDNPDVKGAGCNFCPRCLRMDSLSGVFSLGTPPCMPNYALGAKTCWPLPSTALIEGEEDCSFYPNPVYQNLIIKNAKGKMKVLYDAFGQAVLSTTKDEIDVSKYPKGLYYIRCENKSKKVLIE